MLFMTLEEYQARVLSVDDLEAKILVDLETVREQTLREAMAAAEGERLHEDTGTEPDKAYERAIDDVTAAIRALLEGKAND